MSIYVGGDMKSINTKSKEIYRRALNLSKGLWKYNFNEIFDDKKRIDIGANLKLDYSITDTYKIVETELNSKGYVITDWIGGYCSKEGDKNTYKIGKIVGDNDYVLNKFRDCAYRQNVKIVLSRHPYDIACASYGQDWSSCLNIEDGACREELEDGLITNMVLIAYLVPDSKKGNSKPLGRVLILPYVNRKLGLHHLTVASTAYGIFQQEHKDYIQKWLNEKYNTPYITPKLTDDLNYVFDFPHGFIYDNGDEDCIYVSNPLILSNRKYIRKAINQGKLLEAIATNAGHNTSSGIETNCGKNAIIDELNKYLEYHDYYGGIGSDKSYKNAVMSRHFMMNTCPDSNTIDMLNYVDFLAKHGLKVNRLRKFEKYIEEDAPCITLFNKYRKILDKPIVWDNGHKLIQGLYATQNSKGYKDLVEKICPIYK